MDQAKAGMEMLKLLGEIERALPTAVWQRVFPPGAPADARCFQGHAGEWFVSVADFEITSQGFPEGARSADGAAMNKKRATVIHLTRELAALAHGFALAAVQS